MEWSLQGSWGGSLDVPAGLLSYEPSVPLVHPVLRGHPGDSLCASFLELFLFSGGLQGLGRCFPATLFEGFISGWSLPGLLWVGLRLSICDMRWLEQICGAQRPLGNLGKF